MKMAYNSPKLMIHGDVQEITQAFGARTAGDFVFIGGSNITSPISALGSRDGIINPTPPTP